MFPERQACVRNAQELSIRSLEHFLIRITNNLLGVKMKQRDRSSDGTTACGGSVVSVLGLLAVAVCSALTGCDGSSGEVSTDKVADLVLNSVTWAPEKLLAFVRYDGAYVVAPTGGELRRVVDGTADDPTWAPSRQELAVVVRERGEYPTMDAAEIKLVGLGPSKARNLSHSPADDVDPSWSPDGERVVFASNRSGNYDIYAVDRKGRNLRRLTHHRFDEVAPDWSPDGRTIVFRRHEKHYVGSHSREAVVEVAANGKGKGERKLTSFVPHQNLNQCCWRVEWSPDGRRVAFDLGASIRVIDIASGSSNVVASGGMAPMWSPDSTHIVFEGWAPSDCSGVVGFCLGVRFTGLWVMKADGSQKFSLNKRAKVPSLVTVGSSWSPNGRRIAFVLDIDGSRSIAVAAADGHSFEQLHLVSSSTAG